MNKEDLQLEQYKIPEGWFWELDSRAKTLELFPSPIETATVANKIRRPVARVEFSKIPTAFSWHNNEHQDEDKEFPTIHEAIQYLVTLVGLGMYTL